jgi:hypothetical protein
MAKCLSAWYNEKHRGRLLKAYDSRQRRMQLHLALMCAPRLSIASARYPSNLFEAGRIIAG